jgi:hypothetical protein
MCSRDTTEASIKYNVKRHFYVSSMHNTVLQGIQSASEFTYYTTYYEYSFNYTPCKACKFQCSQKHQHKRRITQDLCYARIKVSCCSVGYESSYFPSDNSIKLGRKLLFLVSPTDFHRKKHFKSGKETFNRISSASLLLVPELPG